MRRRQQPPPPLQLGGRWAATEARGSSAKAEAHRQVQGGQYEAALYFPPDFTNRLDAFRAALRHRAAILSFRERGRR